MYYISYYTSYIVNFARLTSKEIKQVLALYGVSFEDRVAARRTLEERKILKEKHKCQVCILYIITHVIIMQGVYTLHIISYIIKMPGVYDQHDRLRVPSLWPHDDLHLLWPQTGQLSYLQKADCQGY